MILSAHALLLRNVNPSRAEIVEAISGNICRCTGYGQIVEAIELAAERTRGRNLPLAPAAARPRAHRDIAAAEDAPEEGIIEATDADLPHGATP
jgi:carbon-monoxide dehydrogenase small subunit